MQIHGQKLFFFSIVCPPCTLLNKLEHEHILLQSVIDTYTQEISPFIMMALKQMWIKGMKVN